MQVLSPWREGEVVTETAGAGMATYAVAVAEDAAVEEYSQLIDLEENRVVGERYELSFRYTHHGDVVTRWSVQLVARTSSNGHAETLFASGQASIGDAASRQDLAATDFEATYMLYERHWRSLLEAAESATRSEAEQRHHADALTLCGQAWRGTHGHVVADRLRTFAAISVVALASDPALHVVRRAAAHYPEPVTLAIYRPDERQLDLTLLDTATIEALIDDPGPLRAGADSSAGTVLTGPDAYGLLHPGYIGSTATTGFKDHR